MNAARATQIQLAATLAFAVLLTGGIGVARAMSPSCQTLVVASSDEKATLLGSFASAFNQQHVMVGGACVRVSVEQVNSGDAERGLEQSWSGVGKPRPDVWTPASRAWVVLLLARSPDAAAIVPGNWDKKSLFQSPLVIAMPQPMAQALGYPGRPLGWADVFALEQSRAGWGSVGQDWGAFRLGKTNPNISTSGLHALIGSYYAATGGDLSQQAVASPAAQAFVAGIEAAVVHYGDTASDFLAKLKDADTHGQALSYISAIAIEEKELVDYNRGYVHGVNVGVPNVKLVPIYPKEGTLVADHPYVTLQWSHKQAAADAFFDFVTGTQQQAVADQQGFRDDFGRAGRWLSQRPFIEGGQPTVIIHATDVVRPILDSWQTLRKRARVEVVVDTSTAAGESAVQAAAQLADGALGLGPADQAGVWTFPAPAAAPRPYVAVLPISADRPKLESTLKGIAVGGGQATNLDQVVRLAVTEMAASYQPDAIDAVLLVEMAPGGEDPGDDQLDSFLRAQPADRYVRVFTIGPAASQRLVGIALAGGGAAYATGGGSSFLSELFSSF